MRKVVALSRPVLISSMNSTFLPPTMISPAHHNCPGFWLHHAWSASEKARGKGGFCGLARPWGGRVRGLGWFKSSGGGSDWGRGVVEEGGGMGIRRWNGLAGHPEGPRQGGRDRA